MRIAYIKVGLNSYLNQAVGTLLRTGFPGHEVVAFDVTHDLFGGSAKAVLTGALCALRQYGIKALHSRNSLLNNFYTAGYFHAVRRLARRKINPRDFAFSFQTQSLFDASVPGLPHFVYTDHTHLANLSYPGFNRDNLAPANWIELEGEIYRNAAMIFTMSSNISSSLTEQYDIPPEKITCVYAGCNLTPETANTDGEKRRDKNILFTGRDWRRKGGPELLAAFTNLKQRHPEATLTIAGCTPDQLLPDGVSAPGAISRKKLIDCYREAAVFCLPTKMEPFGLAILEAMAFGLPVVATRIGAIPDMVEHGKNGLLVEPGDIAALTDSLIQLMDNPELRKNYGKAGRELAASRYTWDAVGQRIRQVITEYLT